jgi:DNA-binding response OmpR family regulator
LLRKGSALRWIAARSRNGETTPTVLLCGLEQHRQIQAGYRAGARLCLSRPIRGDVLGYHLQGVLAAAQPRTVRLGKLSLDPLRRLLAFPGGRTVPLPPQEFVFLYTLAGQLGEPISHRELIDQVWSHKPPPGTRSDLPPVVMRLRRLLGGYAWMVRAVHGSGYQLSVDPPSK